MRGRSPVADQVLRFDLANYILALSSLILRRRQLVMKLPLPLANTNNPCARTPIPQPRNGHCTHQILGVANQLWVHIAGLLRMAAMRANSWMFFSA
jgi:hypothetical protein